MLNENGQTLYFEDKLKSLIFYLRIPLEKEKMLTLTFQYKKNPNKVHTTCALF